MNRRDEDATLTGGENPEAMDPELRQTLSNFKSSVHAWSDAMMSRPREVKVPARTNWRLVANWALGCAVFAGTVSGAVYQNHRQQEAARTEAARITEQQRQLVAQREREAKEQEEEDLMAKVDSDVAREVPSALEPLASLMNEDAGN